MTPFAPPTRPRLPERRGLAPDERRSLLRAHMDAVGAWETALAEWEAGLPRTERLVFDSGDCVRLVTPSLLHPPGWRVTAVSTLDRQPLGHMEYHTRYDALKEAVQGDAGRIPKIPFEVEPLLRRPSFP